MYAGKAPPKPKAKAVTAKVYSKELDRLRAICKQATIKCALCWLCSVCWVCCAVCACRLRCVCHVGCVG